MMKRLLTDRLLLALLLTTLTLFRLSLIDRGAYAFWDEIRYRTALKATANLLDGDWARFTRRIMSTDGRPGDTLLRLPATSLQLYLKKQLDLPTKSKLSTLIPQIQNVLFSILILAVFYCLAAALLPEAALPCDAALLSDATLLSDAGQLSDAALLSDATLLPKIAGLPLPLAATFVYALLANNQLYVRHILPYEGALTLHMLAALLALRGQRTINLFCCGLLCGLSILAYPGYYAWPLLVCCCAIGARLPAIKPALPTPAEVLALAGVIVAGCALPLVLMEFVTRLSGISYLASEKRLSTLIIQGEYAEGFSFIFDYLRSVEGAMGLLLLAGVFLYFFDLANRVYRAGGIKSVTGLDLFILGTVMIWFVHASATFFLHRFVFYGRLLHQYYPGLVLAWFGIIARLNSAVLKRVAQTFTLLTASVCFFSFSFDYYRIAYPRDVLYNLGIDTDLIPGQQRLAESPPQMNYYSPKPQNEKTRAPYSTLNDYVLVNFAFFSPVRDEPYVPFNPRFIPALGVNEIFEHDHFLSFTPYTFEGFWRIARHNLRTRKYSLRVFRLPPTNHQAYTRFHAYQWSNPHLRGLGECSSPDVSSPNSSRNSSIISSTSSAMPSSEMPSSGSSSDLQATED